MATKRFKTNDGYTLFYVDGQWVDALTPETVDLTFAGDGTGPLEVNSAERIAGVLDEVGPREVLIQLSLIAGNVVCARDTVKIANFDLTVAHWRDLENLEIMRPLLETFMGEKLLSFELGDACEYGPFLTCYFAGGDVHNISVYAIDAFDGEHIFGRERTD